jgi:LL-diaminopimelate aminotransferase
MVQINSTVSNFPVYPFAALAAKRREIQSSGKRLFDFSKGDPISPTPEFIRTALIQAVPTVSQYPAVAGLPELRSAVADYVKRRFDVSLDPAKEVLHCNGTKEAIFNLAATVLGPESPRRIVIGADPSYPVVDRSNLIFGAIPYQIKLSAENNFLLDLATVPESILDQTAIVWLNYPNNPTGATCDLEYLRRQVGIAQRHGILICSDECYVDIYLGERRPPSALEVSKEGVVVFQSCSKRSGMTGYRSGFIAGDAAVLKAYLSLRDSVGTESPVFVQAAAIAAWNDDEHPKVRRSEFREKHQILTEFFDRVGLEYLLTDATFYIWLKTPSGISGIEYSAKLAEHGVLVAPGEYFGTHCADRVRVALVPSVQDTREATRVWEEHGLGKGVESCLGN